MKRRHGRRCLRRGNSRVGKLGGNEPVQPDCRKDHALVSRMQCGYINFMNFSLASSMTWAVISVNPRSFAIRSISRRAIGRMKSGILSMRCSASFVHAMPLGESFLESSMTCKVMFLYPCLRA